MIRRYSHGFTVVAILLAISLRAWGAQPLMQVPPSKPLLGFGDEKDWILTQPLVYVIGKTTFRIVVPAGFVTDLASIPQALWSSGLTPTGQYGRAAIVHDYLYWTQKCSRAEADNFLLIAMKESAVGEFDETAIYAGVHAGGGSAWKGDAAERKSGLVRTLPPDWREPKVANMTWPAYRKLADAAGIKDATPPDDGSYCRLGDSRSVP